MVPFLLLDSLTKRMEEVFEHVRLKDPQQDLLGEEDQNYVPLNIYRQELPEKPADDVTLYPYLRLELSDGSQDSIDGPQTARVLFTVAVYDMDNKYQGWKYTATIMQKAIESIKRRPRINNMFELAYPLQWMFHDEDLYPYFFGGVIAVFEIPVHVMDESEIKEMI